MRPARVLLLGVMATVAGCSSKPAPFAPLGIEVSAKGDHCLLALKGRPVGDLDDFQTKLTLKRALPPPPFSAGIRVAGTVPSACVQKVYEVLRTAHVRTVGIIAQPNQGIPVQP
ncbi:MAG TPA: hypothetical protein VKQ09_07660 [Sphingomonas sp.]|nr:hypothetical protein [Sphingomonas sp.]